MAIRFQNENPAHSNELKSYARGEIPDSDLKKKNVIVSRPIFMDLRGPERYKSSTPDQFKRNK